MWPDRVSNPGPLTYESGALPTAQRGPAWCCGGNHYTKSLWSYFPKGRSMAAGGSNDSEKNVGALQNRPGNFTRKY